MTKRLIYTIFCFVLLCITSCTPEALQPEKTWGDGFQTLRFSGRDFEAVSITTRSSLGEKAERRILNLFTIIFDNSGKVVYSHYFSPDERKTSVAEFEANKYGWAIEEDAVSTSGVLRMKAPNISDGRLYLIANIADEIFNISSTSLSMVQTETDMLNFITRYNIATTKRTGSFIMVGSADIVSINNSTATFVSGHSPVVIERVDSKIDFRVAIVPGAVTIHNQGTPDESIQTIESFEPQSWQVINVPKSTFLKERAVDADPTNPDNFFDGKVLGFETSVSETYGMDERVVHGFSFYMFENRQTANRHGVVPTGAALPEGYSSYHYRDKRTKTASGTYTNSGNMWEYAPENATYLKIQGVVNMQYEGAAVATSQTLHSLATYYIHLGDFATDINNYDIERNTHYTYTINIHGVDNIQVEIEKDNNLGWNATNEKESGATGEVFVSQEEVYVFDAHYGQRVFKFNANGMLGQSGGDVNKLTWFVSTPFGHRGMPEKVGTDAVDITTGLDYRWVNFVVNSKESSYTEPHGALDGGPLSITNTYYPNYCQLNRAWPGTGDPQIMDVVGFCSFLRSELRKYKADPGKTDPDPAKHHVFDSEGNLYVTVFVDEYYYDRDPTSNETRASLWHEFANEPMRTMHIMCNSAVSVDGESSLILSAVSIRQLSIQTVYNAQTASEGWGTESKDEFAIRHTAFFYNRDTESRAKNMYSITNHNLGLSAGNTSKTNGLFNSGHLWGLLDGSNNYVADKVWSEHLDYSQVNEVGNVNNFLRDDPVSETLRYACLSRNRDENGNGIIDKEEIKWYTAATGQLHELYLGGLGLTGDARMYNIKAPQNTFVPDNHGDNYYSWREHVVSSTATPSLVTENGAKDNKYRVQIVWSEEGPSVSTYGMDCAWGKPPIYSLRCVRNLDNGHIPHDMEVESDTPEGMVEVTNNADGTVTIDFTRLNDHSKRPKVNSELLPLDENSSMSLVSNSFQTGEDAKNPNGSLWYQTYNYFLTLKDNLETGLGPCPTGYHTPNIREMTAIYLYANHLLGINKYFVCNYFSFGHEEVGGNGYDAIADGVVSKKQYTWTFTGNNITLDPGVNNVRIRCIKDL